MVGLAHEVAALIVGQALEADRALIGVRNERARIARVTDAVVIGVGLIGVRHERAVILEVEQTVAVAVGRGHVVIDRASHRRQIGAIAEAITVRVLRFGGVVRERVVRVRNAVAVDIGILIVGDAIAVEIAVQHGNDQRAAERDVVGADDDRRDDRACGVVAIVGAHDIGARVRGEREATIDIERGGLHGRSVERAEELDDDAAAGAVGTRGLTVHDRRGHLGEREVEVDVDRRLLRDHGDALVRHRARRRDEHDLSRAGRDRIEQIAAARVGCGDRAELGHGDVRDGKRRVVGRDVTADRAGLRELDGAEVADERRVGADGDPSRRQRRHRHVGKHAKLPASRRHALQIEAAVLITRRTDRYALEEHEAARCGNVG